jgi:hypothetical protein
MGNANRRVKTCRERLKMQNNQPTEPMPGGGQQAGTDQDGYDIFVAQGIKLASAASQKLKGNASIDILGNTLFEIVTKIEAEGEKNGVAFDQAVLLHGSNEILAHLIEMSGVDISEEQVKAVVGIAVGKYLNNAVKTGKMTTEEVQQLAQQAQQAQQGGGAPQPGAAPQPAATPQPGASAGLAAPQSGGMPNV